MPQTFIKVFTPAAIDGDNPTFLAEWQVRTIERGKGRYRDARPAIDGYLLTTVGDQKYFTADLRQYSLGEVDAEYRKIDQDGDAWKQVEYPIT